MNKEFLGILVIKLLVAILLITTYLYIEKLENTGCECAEHENKEFIKKFSLFAFVYYIITLLVNPTSIKMNSSVTMLYLVVELIFLVTIVFYFYYTVNYTRYLISTWMKSVRGRSFPNQFTHIHLSLVAPGIFQGVLYYKSFSKP